MYVCVRECFEIDLASIIDRVCRVHDWHGLHCAFVIKIKFVSSECKRKNKGLTGFGKDGNELS